MRQISSESYHGDTTRISKSGLDLIERSPAHYFAQYLDPKREERKMTQAFKAGSAVHISTLEPELFSQLYVVSPQINKSTKSGKEEWATFQADHAGKTILTVKDYDMAMFARDAVRNHETAAYLIREGWAERTWYWTDLETGVKCKCRTDFLNVDDYVIDVKTTEDARPEQFGRSCYKYRYDKQGAFYLDGVQQAREQRRPKAFIFIAVEKTKPYNVGVYYLTGEQAKSGREKYRKDLGIYSNCQRTGEWPGYSQEIQPLKLPPWAD